jgi:hypothetical protein
VDETLILMATYCANYIMAMMYAGAASWASNCNFIDFLTFIPPKETKIALWKAHTLILLLISTMFYER